MLRILAMIGIFALSIPLALAGGKSTLADDLKKLQGVWQSAPNAKKQLKIMFMNDKLGYDVSDPKAKPGEGLLNFLALSNAQLKDTKGQRAFEIEVAKDYVKRISYRFDKDSLTITADGDEYKVERASTQASANADAKKLLGRWRILDVEHQGKKQKLTDFGLDAIVITEDRYQLIGPGDKELLNSFYRVDATKTPAIMDWYGMKPTFVIPLIYEIKDNEIRLAHPPFHLIGKGAPRPANFDAKNDTLVIRADRKK